MNERTKRVEVAPRLLSRSDLCQYTGLGISKAHNWAEEIGAIRRFGSRVLYDRIVIDAAIDDMAPKEVGGNGS